MTVIPIAQQIKAVEGIVARKPAGADIDALKAVVLTLGVFAQGPDAFRAYAKELKRMKQQPAVAAVLEEFPGAYIAGIDP